MENVLHADIFFFITTIVVVLLAIALLILIIYIIRIAHDLKKVSGLLRSGVENVADKVATAETIINAIKNTFTGGSAPKKRRKKKVEEEV